MTASFKIDAEHPWPWLDAFPEYAERFFNGRDDEKAALFRCVLSAPVTVLFGKSGLGKSSLLQAGLFPQLRGERLLPVYVRLLHDQNAPEICAQLAKRFSEEIHKTQSPGAASPPLHYHYRQNQNDEDAEPIILTDDLWADLHRNDIELVDETGKRWQPVFVLDQFEEIFTLGGQNPNRQTHCFYQLGDLLENRIPRTLAERLNEDDELFDQLNPDSQAYRFLLSLREDYLPDLEEWSELIPRLSLNRFRLLSMTAPQAVAAVEKTGGGLVTHQDAENIVHYLSTHETADQQKRRGTTQIEPALLGLMCAGLNEDRLRSRNKCLNTDNLDKQGGLIVERFYDQAFAELPDSVHDFVEQHLITADGVRLAYPQQTILSGRLATSDQLQTLIDRRLLRRESLEDGNRIELVHDRLAQAALRRRQDSDRRKAIEKEQKRRRQLLSSSAGLLVLCAMFSNYMWQTSEEAKSSERKARRAELTATAIRLVTEGNAISSGMHPGSDLIGLLKILAGYRLHQQSNNNTELVNDVLQSEFIKFRSLKLLISTDTCIWTVVTISPNGQNIASGCIDGTLRFRDAQSGLAIGKPLKGHEDSIESIAFSLDGQRIISGSLDGTLILWDTHSGSVINTFLHGHRNGVSSVAISPDGQRIVSGSWDNTLRLWDTDSGTAIGPPLQGHKEVVRSVAFSPDGQRIVSGSDDKTLRLWDARNGKTIGKSIYGHKGVVRSVAFSPDGQRIVSGSDDKTLRLWSANSGKSIGAPLQGHENTVSSVAFSPDGQRIVSGSWDNTLRLWDSNNGATIGRPLKGHENLVWSVAFSPDGQRIISSALDNTLRIWDSPINATIATVTHDRQDMTRSRTSLRSSFTTHYSDDKKLQILSELEVIAGNLCKKLPRNMSLKEWREWVSPDIDYIKQCSGLPIPRDEPDNPVVAE